MSTDNETLIKALRILARDIVSDDGVANACVDEAAARIEELLKENEQLKLANAELVEALKMSRQFVDHSPDCICRGCERIETALAKHGGAQ